MDPNKDDPYQQNGIDAQEPESKPEEPQQEPQKDNNENNQNNGNVEIEEAKQAEQPEHEEQQQEVIKPVEQPVVKPKPKPKPVANPYVDSSVAQNFMSAADNDKFVQKHDVVPQKSKVANAYDLFKEKMGSKPKNTIQFLAFVEKNNLGLTYSECSQYMQYMKKYEDESSSEEDEGAGYSRYGV
eukprot:CAMPEP_0201581530 /NCGR_PEP_ID=MMETSP0190_2-20130828/70667_1 /ASSEMBLY_ACC=CAM_ASM_000263 /TAXON_ID=37353 /ORGANISM="Rosalina sp." /LENGTH=183 /DNA_ID=CAMNT_0048019727 /DNA_START=185 /DNA_END=736 /DNA_ORIENTATION=+